MAEFSLGAITLIIGADTRELDKGKGKAEKAFKDINKQAVGVEQTMKRLGVILAGIFTIATVKSLVEGAAQFVQLSQRMGISITAASELSGAVTALAIRFLSARVVTMLPRTPHPVHGQELPAPLADQDACATNVHLQQFEPAKVDEVLACKDEARHRTPLRLKTYLEMAESPAPNHRRDFGDVTFARC